MSILLITDKFLSYISQLKYYFNYYNETKNLAIRKTIDYFNKDILKRTYYFTKNSLNS